MSKIIDVNLKMHDPNNVQIPNIPKRGFHVTLSYMYGDADGYKDVSVGPFPDEKKHLLIEFLNVLEDMATRYPHGKGGFDGYEDVPNYNKWFDTETMEEEGEPDFENPDDAAFRDNLELEVECAPDGYGSIASFQGYTIIWRDGKTLSEYAVNLTKTPD